MAYRMGDRNQQNLLPECIEDFVGAEDNARIYDEFVNSLNLEEIGINLNAHRVGNPEYDPRKMLKLLVFGYSYGLRSSRDLERATYHNLSFIWLMGGLRPDHKTIAEFRRENKGALKLLIKQCAKICIKMGLIDGDSVFLDSSKFRGNASIRNTLDKKKCQSRLRRLDEKIDKIFEEAEELDAADKGNSVNYPKELGSLQEMKAKVRQLAKEIQESEKTSINLTDRECVKIKGRQGTHAGYCGHIVVDEKNGLIINSDVVSENNDKNQFKNQIAEAEKVTGKPCKSACADAGYANTDNLKDVHDRGVKVVVPSAKQTTGKEPEEFDKERFKYNEKEDAYKCPEGKTLKYINFTKDGNHKIYRISESKDCRTCKNYGTCTSSKRGREIKRLKNERVKEELGKMYESEEGQNIYKKRQGKAEHPFGHMKSNLGAGSFLIRGKLGANAEMSILSTCFNLARMKTIKGFTGLITGFRMAT